MAAVAVTVADSKEVTVTDDGVIITFSGSPLSKLVLHALAANPGVIQYSLDDATILDGADLADDAAIKADGALYLEPGDTRLRTSGTFTQLFLRSASGVTTNKVKIETK